jgi:hypothetical protein
VGANRKTAKDTNYPVRQFWILDYGGEYMKKQSEGEQINLSSNPKSKIGGL